MNAAPHVGTAWNKTLKDTIIRYRRMNGYNVRDQPGYDCHGLPVEVMVEKILKVTNKKDIEDVVGIAQFIAKCKEYAAENVEAQTRVFKDIGVWMDWERPYLTYNDPYIESVWWTIKRASEKKLLFKGLRVVHWCPRCETALAGYEVTDEYRLVTDPSIYVKMVLEDHPDESILVWTTTPWTLPANMGVMVHPDEEYVKVEVDGEKLIMAKKRLEHVLGERPYRVLEEMKGKQLEGIQYRPPLREETGTETGGKLHRVLLSAEHVSMMEGTGAVHTAPGHGEEDFEVGREYGLPIFSPVDQTGRFTKEAGKYDGMPIREANQVILENLASKNLLWKQGTIEHSYPHCWRCKTPLLLRATEQWFIKVTAFKKGMLRENRKVEWTPDWAGSKRFHDWLTGARDWVISRQRYWGVPIPVWHCETCGTNTVIGSRRELVKLAVNLPKKKFDLHRSGVDQILVRCRKCRGMARREPDILDVWLDSGIASWADLGFPMEKRDYNAWWPAEVIVEAHDQTRGWFYNQLGSSMVAFGRAPYKRVLMHGHTLDVQGEKFSKSKGNFVSPSDATAKYGRDALRFYTLQATVWEDFRFSWNEMEAAGKDLLLAWNVFSFATLYMNLDGYDPSRWTIPKLHPSLRPEDRWLVSRTEALKIRTTECLEKLEIHHAARALASFMVDDLSHWYIRLVRRRFWQERESPDKLAAYAVLYRALRTWLVLAAPFVPFITETVYLNSFRAVEPKHPETVHMLQWPKPSREWVNKQLETEMRIAQDVSSAVASARQSKKVKLRQPVSTILIVTQNPTVRRTVKALKNLLLQQANAKEVRTVGLAEEEKLKRLLLEPNYKGLGPSFRHDAGRVAEALRTQDARKVYQSIIEEKQFMLNYGGTEYPITGPMVNFREEMPENYAMGEFSEGRVYVDLTIPEALVQEGFVRDIVRRLQELRRRLDLPVEAYVDAYVTVPQPEKREWLEDEQDYLKQEVRVKTLHLLRSGDESPKMQAEEEWEIDGQNYKMGIAQLKG